jgi:2-dehydropantoate 2-reductase
MAAMKIAVIGAGAMGCLFGARLAEAGHEVCVYERAPAIVAAINRHGLVIEAAGESRTVRLNVAAEPGTASATDLVLAFVKAYQTADAAPLAAQLAGAGGLVVTLQNGMGNAELLAACLAPARIIAGSTAHGATVLGPGHIRHAGSGATTIGMWSCEDSDRARADGVARVFTAAGVETRAVTDVRPVLWEKLLVNAGINAITALTGIRNGGLLELDASRRLSAAAVAEGAAVARMAGITVREDIVAHVLQVAAATAGNRSSMGQDVDQRRPTEIAAINGFIVREAARLGLPAPVNETLTALIEILQHHYR